MNKVSIIGSGNVATHLTKRLHVLGFSIIQVFSKDLENAKVLASMVNAEALNSISELNSKLTDVILISVKDDAIEKLSNQINSGTSLVAHTSGTMEMDVLKNHKNHGVFYPLQTFSKNKEIDLSIVPFCLEGNTKETKLALLELASNISTDVRFVDSEKRKSLHIAAVFACNFSNHMLAISEKLLLESKQDLSILKPLVVETIAKAFLVNPKDAQTGPAVRNDTKVIQNHLSQLSNEPLLQDIYAQISKSINQFKNE